MALTARIPLQLEPEEKRALARRAKAAGITVNEYARRALRAFNPDALVEEQIAAVLKELDASTDQAERSLDAAMASIAASNKRLSRLNRSAVTKSGR
jgi:hypothetical protein